jgi:carboxyl-terminal processing protease
MKMVNYLKMLFMILSVFTLTACENMFAPEPLSDPESLFENFWQTFKDDCAVFEERNVDWDNLYLQYRPQVNKFTDESTLYNIFTKLMEPVNDGHVALLAPHYGTYSANVHLRNKVDSELFDKEIIGLYLEEGYKTDRKHYVYGKLKDHNIGYIQFDHFRASAVKLNELVNEFPDVKGYIIDLRHNNGGDVSFSFPFLGKFAKESRLFLKSKTKNGKGEDDYTDWFNWYINPSGKYLDKKLIILTDRHTVSAAERMVMAAKSLGNTLVVGDTTNGTLGTKISRELANGWVYSYSVQKVIMYDGNSYEGIGIAPDIFVKNDLLNIYKGVDKVLQTAMDQFN